MVCFMQKSVWLFFSEHKCVQPSCVTSPLPHPPVCLHPLYPSESPWPLCTADLLRAAKDGWVLPLQAPFWTLVNTEMTQDGRPGKEHTRYSLNQAELPLFYFAPYSLSPKSSSPPIFFLLQLQRRNHGHPSLYVRLAFEICM